MWHFLHPDSRYQVDISLQELRHLAIFPKSQALTSMDLFSAHPWKFYGVQVCGENYHLLSLFRGSLQKAVHFSLSQKVAAM